MRGPHERATTPSRRTVVRACAHAAWAVPVVVLAAAAPAYAASPGMLAVTLGPLVRTPSPTNVGNLNTLAPVSTITNNGTAPSTALTVIVSVTPTAPGDNFTGTTATAVAGFTGPERTGDPGRTALFSYVATTQLQPGTPLMFSPTVSLSLAVAGSLTVTAVPGNGAAGSATSTFT